MMRNELLRQIAALPENTDVGIQFGADHLDIAEIVPWGNGQFGALKCDAGDLRDVILAGGFPADGP